MEYIRILEYRYNHKISHSGNVFTATGPPKLAAKTSSQKRRASTVNGLIISTMLELFSTRGTIMKDEFRKHCYTYYNSVFLFQIHKFIKNCETQRAKAKLWIKNLVHIFENMHFKITYRQESNPWRHCVSATRCSSHRPQCRRQNASSAPEARGCRKPKSFNACFYTGWHWFAVYLGEMKVPTHVVRRDDWHWFVVHFRKKFAAQCTYKEYAQLRQKAALGCGSAGEAIENLKF